MKQLALDIGLASGPTLAGFFAGPNEPALRHLQLWVASCLYYGARDMAVRMHGELDEESERMLLEVGKRFGTTLQVPEEMWHADVEDFERYWYSDELSAARERVMEWYDKPLLPGWHRLIGSE